MNKIIYPLIAIVALLGGYFISEAISPKNIQIKSATWFKKPMPLPQFTLTDHNNVTLDNARLLDKWNILFFGFTHCPDVCPDSLNMLKTMMEHLEPDERNKIQVIFVSVDPERDTADILKKYVTFFNEDFLGAFTPLANLEPLTKQLGIMHYITKTQSTYDVAHAGNILLINPNAEYNAVFSPPHDPIQMALDLQTILENH